MAEYLNPVPALDDLHDVFAEGARSSDGLQLDPVLCGHIAEGLREAAAGVAALVDFVRAYGLVQPIEAAAAGTPAERRQLARLAAPLDPEGRVVALPVPARRPVAIAEGGSAA